MDRDKGILPDQRPDECRAWQRLVEKLYDSFPEVNWPRKGLGSFPIAPPNAKWKMGKVPAMEVLSGNPNAFDADFIIVEKPFLADIEAAIRARCSGRSVPMSPEALYFVAVRAYVVIWFVRQFEIEREIPHSTKDKCEASETIIPFPDARSWHGIIEWLMIDWWKNHGSYLAALLRLAEMHTGLEPENS